VAAALVLATSAEVLDLNPSTFDQHVDGSAPAFVEFFAPWCGHCKKLAPEYEIVGKAFERNQNDVVVAKVDCDSHRDLCSRFDVKGYPTLKWFPKGETKEPEAYSGGRTADDIVQFINRQTGLKARVPGAKAGALVDLTDDTFNGVVLDKSKHVFVEFYAPWCGHCKNLEPDYIQFADAFANEDDVVVARIDADEYKLRSSEYGVSGFPTLKWFPKEDKSGTEYSSGRSLEDLVGFVNLHADKRRNTDGTLQEDAGLIVQLDDLVEEFLGASDKASVVEKARREVDQLEGLESRLGKVYLRAMTKIAEGDENYPRTETGRLNRMLGGSLKPTKADEFQMRLNILKQFL